MRITKQLREDAIIYCLMMADWSNYPTFLSGTTAVNSVWVLSITVLNHVTTIIKHNRNDDSRDKDQSRWLECAALLREGWRDGDGVVRL